MGAVDGGGTEADALGAEVLEADGAEADTAAPTALAETLAVALGAAVGVEGVEGIDVAAMGAEGRGPSNAKLSAAIAQAPIAIVPIATLRRRRSPASASA